MTRRFFSGTSVQQAVLRAAGHYSIDPGEVEYKELDKRHGFLRLRRKVVIEVDPESPRRADAGEASAEPTPAATGAAESITAATGAAESTPAATEAAESIPAAADVAGSTATAAEAAVTPSASGSDVTSMTSEVSTTRPSTPTPTSQAPEAPRAPEVPEAQVSPPAPEVRSDQEAPAAPETEASDPATAATQDSTESSDGGSDASPARAGRPSRRRRSGRRTRQTPSISGRLVGLPDRPIPATERYPAATGATALAAEMAMKVALELLAMEARVNVRQGDGQLEIELETEDQDRLLDDDGRILASLQHLLPRLIRGFIGEGVMCRLDCDNFLQIREEQLRNMAQAAADEVKRQGRPWTMKPMSPEERRLVHLALESDATVKTDSVGDGFFKRVRVRPA